MNDLQARLQAALGAAYRIERELGGGGMSRVFVATEVALDRHVVIKVLPPDLAAGLNVERFRREIQLAAKLQHPHIVPLLAAGAADGLLYYTMPLIEGESLRAKLARQGELPIAEGVRILVDVADALAYAHSHGLVHRDIKPDNVLLSGKHAVVMDFGVSKALSNATGESSITSIGVALGTPAYMAPEQAAGDPNTDHRADIYALGILAYELLTGHPPFVGASAQQVLAAQVVQPPPPITKSRTAVPPGLESLVMRCLEKRAADRPQTAGEVLSSLEVLATPSGGMTPIATAPPERSRTAPLRTPWVVAAVAVVVLAGAGLLLLRGGRVAAAGARSVAVLPFENMGGGEPGQSLADGLQDDILTQLTKIGALQVTSRTSVQEYRGSAKPVRQIGRELGVKALLEGQVQRTDKRVHVNVQLIDAGSDRQLWADTYDRELTAQDVFAIQDSIARNVAEAMRVQLSPAEAAAIAGTPTDNMEALDYYHRGRDLFARRGSESADTAAERAFEHAVALDPHFAAAWAGLSESRSWLIRMELAYDTTPASEALKKASGLAPNDPESEMARGFYAYYAKGDYAGALGHFRAVQQARPSDVGAVAAVGYILRRQGNWDEALERELRVTKLDPRDAGALWDLGGTYLQLRRFTDAEQVLERSLVLFPDFESARGFMFSTLIMAGDTARAASFAKQSEGHVSAWTSTGMAGVVAMLRRDYRAALRTFAEGTKPTNPPQFRARLLMLSLLSHEAGDARLTQLYSDSSRIRCEADLRKLAGEADVFGRLADIHAQLGLAYALLGRKEDAVREGRTAVQLNPVSRDAIEGPRSVAQLAAILFLTGDRDQAFEKLGYLVTTVSSNVRPGPSAITAGLLKLDPLYDPIRGDPRFTALVHDLTVREGH